jgi:PAS domain S-box-containing protein
MGAKDFINERLINKISIGIFYHDANGVPIYANKAAERIFGITFEKIIELSNDDYGFEII